MTTKPPYVDPNPPMVIRVSPLVHDRLETWIACQPDTNLTVAEAAKRLMELGLALSRILPGAPRHRLGRPPTRKQRKPEPEAESAEAYDF